MLIIINPLVVAFSNFRFKFEILNQSLYFLSTMNATTKKPGLKGQHPFMDINNPKVKLEEGEDLFLCLQFLESICTQPCCDRISGHKRNQRCSCLCILIGSDARQMAVAKYMVAFANKPQQERHSIIMEWLRYTPSMIKKRRPFLFLYSFRCVGRR